MNGDAPVNLGLPKPLISCTATYNTKTLNISSKNTAYKAPTY